MIKMILEREILPRDLSISVSTFGSWLWCFAPLYMYMYIIVFETLQDDSCYNADSESCNKIIRHRVTLDAKNYVEVIVSKIHVD